LVGKVVVDFGKVEFAVAVEIPSYNLTRPTPVAKVACGRVAMLTLKMSLPAPLLTVNGWRIV